MITETDAPTAIRTARAGDQAFIASTLREQLLRAKVKRSEANAIVDRILDCKRVSVLVTCEQAKPDRIVGWMIYAPMPRVRALVYAYVRAKRRGQKLMRAMTAHAWPSSSGTFVYALHGPHSRELAAKYSAVQLSLDELLA